MVIDQIREKLAIKISDDERWVNALDDSNPGHYGVHNWDVHLTYADVFVDIPNKTFNFKNASFDFEVQIGSSNDDDGLKMDFSRKAKGNGTFIFESGSDVEVDELHLEFDLDLIK